MWMSTEWRAHEIYGNALTKGAVCKGENQLKLQKQWGLGSNTVRTKL